MHGISFASSPGPSLGVEIELALVDGESMALANRFPEVSDRIPDEFNDSIKPELMQCYAEVNSRVCRTVDEAATDLGAKIAALEGAADDLGLRLLWSGTHPFSHWSQQRITRDDRYYGLVESLQDMARRLVCFGLHVHVGVDSGDKAIMICDRLMRHLPVLLALSCNSPCWSGRATGLRSHRAKIMEGLPTAGLPPLMRNWSEYVWLITHLVETGFINTIREIWWDVRPHHNFGTVEVRMRDVPGSLDDALGLAALTQCLIQALSEEIDRGAYQLDCHPMMVRQNKWRACRFGFDAELIDPFTCEAQPLRARAAELIRQLRPIGEQLECGPWLDRVARYAQGPSWADRQLAILKETGSTIELVRQLTAASRVTPLP